MSREPIGRGVVANLTVLQVAYALMGGEPKGAIVRHKDADHDVTRQALSFRILGELAVAKAESATAIGPNPEVVVQVFRQGPHATVEQTVLFAVSAEAVPIKSGNAAAIESAPHCPVVGGQNSHGGVIRQAVGFCEHSDDTVFEAMESISVCANPPLAIAIAVHVAYFHASDCEFQPGGGPPK